MTHILGEACLHVALCKPPPPPRSGLPSPAVYIGKWFSSPFPHYSPKSRDSAKSPDEVPPLPTPGATARRAQSSSRVTHYFIVYSANQVSGLGVVGVSIYMTAQECRGLNCSWACVFRKKTDFASFPGIFSFSLWRYLFYLEVMP